MVTFANVVESSEAAPTLAVAPEAAVSATVPATVASPSRASSRVPAPAEGRQRRQGQVVFAACVGLLELFACSLEA